LKEVPYDYIGPVREAKSEMVCPNHLEKLKMETDYLLCPDECKFPVRNGVPRFTNDGYSEAFGFQWNQFPKTQLDSYSGTHASHDRAKEAFGTDLWPTLSKASLLEVGCGAGRFTEVFLEQGAIVSSIDLSKAVDVNAQNFPISHEHRVVQADVAKLPFAKESFDFVVCLGVIQHTPKPEDTIQLLASYVKPGGWLLIDHYAKSISWKLRTAPLARQVLKRLSPERAFRITQHLYAFAKYFFVISENRVYRKILNVLFPVVYFSDEIPTLKDQLKDEWGILDTYDSLTDWFKHRRSPADISQTLRDIGMSDIVCFAGGNGVVARARIPEKKGS